MTAPGLTIVIPVYRGASTIGQVWSRNCRH
jgi:hypothetical protein